MNEKTTTGFNGDIFLKKEIHRLVKKHTIRTIIETGTYLGDTTREFASMVQSVHTIELNSQFAAIARLKFGSHPNIVQHMGSSEALLDTILPKTNGPLLFFLDAHWFNYWPILDELKCIAKHSKKTAVIVIHDFYVPHTNLAYDSYIPPSNNRILDALKGSTDKLLRSWFPVCTERLLQKQRLDFDFIKDAVKKINPKYTYHYNAQATGKKRGIIFIEF